MLRSLLTVFTCITLSSSLANAEEPKSTAAKASSVKQTPAQFLEFSFDDASHFVFKDAKGEILDFAGCKAKECAFARELAEGEANEENQGWGSNKELVGKSFLLTYESVEQELYIDGPIGTVHNITKIEPLTVKAEFLEFSFDDASHFVFKDAKGEILDFAGCKAKECGFSRELPKGEANEENQGWGSNKELVGKSFLLTYELLEQELYIDGPVGMTQIISKVEAVAK